MTRQQYLAIGAGPARRFQPQVVPLAALETPSTEAADELLSLVAPGERIWFFLAGVQPAPLPLDLPIWQESRRIPGYQMLCEAPPPPLSQGEQPDSVALDPVRDLADMEALKTVAFPGFFGPRAPEMGRFRGIRVNGELVAMAGERLNLDAPDGRGYREVSAVCTHPDHVGNGYAQRLTQETTTGILANGDTPFLHVAAENMQAQAVYRRLGFVQHGAVVFVEFTRLA